MLTSKKRAIAAGALSLALLAACGTSSDDNASAKPGTNGDKVTLSLWAYEGYEDFLPHLIDGFEKKYPNIKVNVTNIPEEQYTTKIDTALAAGQPPDLGFIYTNLWLKQDQFLPLDAVIKSEKIDTSTWAPGIVGTGEGTNQEDACAFEGKLYCLGSYTGTDMIIYNKDMFDQAGVQAPAPWPPMSLDDYVALSCELKDKVGGGVYGSAQGDPITWLPWSIVVSKDGKKAEGVVNSPETVQLYETVAGMTQKKCSPSLDVLDPWEQGVDYFSQKKLAMVITDVQSLAKIEQAGIHYGITAPPAAGEHGSFFNEWTDGIGVFKASKHANEAMLFVAYQATEGQKLRVDVTHDLPVSVEAAQKYNWAGDVEGRKDLLEILPHAVPNISVPNRWDAAGPLFDAYGSIVAGDDAQSVLDEAAKNFQANLDKAWEEWNSN